MELKSEELVSLEAFIDAISADEQHARSFDFCEDSGVLQMRKESVGLVAKDDSVSMEHVTVDEIKTLAKAAGLPWKDDYAKRAVPYWASDGRVDRHGDIVEQSWKFNDFKDNPVMLYSHAWDMPPIGNVIDYEVTTRTDGPWTGDALYLLGLFATKEDWSWADTIFRLTLANMLRKGSVGFYPGEIVRVKDPEERAKLGLPEWGYILRNNRLFEWSPCSIPAHSRAGQIMNSAKAKGLIVADDLQVMREVVRRTMIDEKCDSKTWQKEDSRLVSMWKAAFPNIVINRATDIDIPIDVQAIQTTSAAAKRVTSQFTAKDDDIRKLLLSLDEKVNQINNVLEDTRGLVEQLSGKKDEEPEGGIVELTDEQLQRSGAARALELLAAQAD